MLYTWPKLHRFCANVDVLGSALKDSKRLSNFLNLLMSALIGKKNGLQIMSSREEATKDEYFYINNETRNDLLAEQRIPSQLMRGVPANADGVGNASETDNVLYRDEAVPLQEWLGALDDLVGYE